MRIIRYIPNTLTSLRIVCAAVLLFLSPLSREFKALYILGGVTDLLDGFIARTAKCTSELGAKLDSAADLSFYAVMLIKLLPEIAARLPWQIWLYVGGVFAVRIASYLAAAIRHGRFASLHTYLNKITGLSLYLVPFVLELKFFFQYCVVLCSIAMIASSEELIIHLRGKAYSVDKRSLLKRERESKA